MFTHILHCGSYMNGSVAQWASSLLLNLKVFRVFASVTVSGRLFHSVTILCEKYELLIWSLDRCFANFRLFPLVSLPLSFKLWSRGVVGPSEVLVGINHVTPMSAVFKAW